MQNYGISVQQLPWWKNVSLGQHRLIRFISLYSRQESENGGPFCGPVLGFSDIYFTLP